MEDWHGTGDRHGGVPIGCDPETTGAEPGEPRIVTAAAEPAPRAGAGAVR